MSADAPPPVEVLVEFLHGVRRLVDEWEEGFVPVLRGSLLLRHWYGECARPPADIDVECFDDPDVEREYEPGDEPPQQDDGFYGPVEGRYGRWGNFVSRVDFGKALCRDAVWGYGPDRPGGDVGIRFRDDESAPDDGASLWVYGTPGKRYYSTWEWVGHSPASGRLQLDLSTPGPYTPADLGVVNEAFTAPGEVGFRFSAYSKEAMLAAKVSWLVRGLMRTGGGRVAWAGEPKDLYDAHLLATDRGLRPDVFRRAMLAVGAADGLDWNGFDVLFDVRRVAVGDGVFGNWPAFAGRYADLVGPGPVTLWGEVADRLGPLLGELYPAEEMPFLCAGNTVGEGRVAHLVYADWLEERGDARGEVLRRIARARFAEGGADEGARREAAEALAGAPLAWLSQVFGTSARLKAFREAVGAK